MTRKALVLGVLVALLASGSAHAADSYRITAGGNQDWGPQSGGLDQTSSTQLQASGTMTGDDNAVGSVDYRLQAGPGIARASMDGRVTVPSNLFYPFNPSLQATATTELTLNGPQADLNTSLNLHVDGVLDDMACGGGRSCGDLSVFIFAPAGTTAGAGSEFTTQGAGRENDLRLTLDRVAGGYHVHGDVTSRVFGLRANQPNPIGIALNLSGRFNGNPATSTFGGSFDDPAKHFQVSFAPDGPVLNDLPADYTVSGPGVVNNRWDDPFSDDFVVDDCDDPELAQVTTIAGNLLVRALQNCDAVTFPQLTHIGGDLVIEGDRAPHVAFPGPVVVDGSVRVVGNDGGGDLDLGDVSVGGAIDVGGNSGDLVIDVGSVGGAFDASGNGGDLTIDTGSVGGAIDVSGTGGDLTIDTGSADAIDVSGTSGNLELDPGIVSGDLDISDNADAGVINVGGGQLGGDLTITDDGTAVVDANDSLIVSGDADVETDGGGMLDLSGVEADGDETVAADGADGVTADTAGGTTDVSILGGTAAMHVVLSDGTFDQPVAFTHPARGRPGRGRPRERRRVGAGGPARRLHVRVRGAGTERVRPAGVHDRSGRARRGHARGAAGGARVRERDDRVQGGCARLDVRRIRPLRGDADAGGRRLRRGHAAGGRRQRRAGGDRARARPLRRDRRALLDLRRGAGQRAQGDAAGRGFAEPAPRVDRLRPDRGADPGATAPPDHSARQGGEDPRAAQARLPAAISSAHRRHREGRVVSAAQGSQAGPDRERPPTGSPPWAARRSG